MIHRITLKSNPRILILFAGLLVLLAAGVLVAILVGPLLGIVVIAVVGLIGYYFVKNTVYHMRSSIESSEEGLSFSFPGDGPNMFRWQDITFAATYTREKSAPYLVVYKEKEDQLMSIPRDFEKFDLLLDEVRRHIKTISTLELGKKELIEDKLKVVLGIESPDEESGS